MSSKIKEILKDLKTLAYDNDKFDELFKSKDKYKAVLRAPEEIGKSRKASCFEASMYMAYKARELRLEPRLFLFIYTHNFKIHYHSYVFIREKQWVLIDWPNNIKEVFRETNLEDIINKTLAMDYGEGEWDHIEVDEINVERCQKTMTFREFTANPYRAYMTSRKDPKVRIDDLDKILDSMQKIDYDIDTLKALTSAKDIELRRKVRLSTVEDIKRYDLGVCYDSRIYLAYLASEYGLDWRYFYYERYDHIKQRFKAHAQVIIEKGGRWHLFVNDDHAPKGKVWAPVYPLKDIRDPDFWVWDTKKVGVVDNFEGYCLYFNIVPKKAIEGLFGAKSLTYGQYIDIVGSRRELVRNKPISRIEVKMYDITAIHYKDGSKIALK